MSNKNKLVAFADLYKQVGEISPEKQSEDQSASALWLNRLIMLGGGKKTVHLQEGDEILILKNEIADCPPNQKPTHVITSLWGNSNFEYSINVIEKKSLQLYTILLQSVQSAIYLRTTGLCVVREFEIQMLGNVTSALITQNPMLNEGCGYSLLKVKI